MSDNQPLFRVETEKQVEKRLRKLQPKHRQQVLKRIIDLQNNPRPQDSIKLKGRNDFRLDMGDYRVLYEIDYEINVVRIWRLIDRKEGYKHL